MKDARGFTLIELIVVLGILSILTLIVFVSLDPLRQFAESRNVRRWNDVNALTTALYRFIITNQSLPPSVSSIKQQLGTAKTGCDRACPGAAAACLDLRAILKPYLEIFPVDPLSGSVERTGYAVSISDSRVVTVEACTPENNSTILMAR